MQPQLRPQVKVIKNWEFNDFFIFTNDFGDEKIKKNQPMFSNKTHMF